MITVKLLISGCRHYRRYFEFARELDKQLSGFKPENILIIEGGARGTDYLAYLYAKRRKIKYVTVEADWDTLGKSAGYVRNVEMMEMATHAIAFWDMKSRGTAHVVRNANQYNVALRVITIKEDLYHGKPKISNRYRSKAIR